METETNTSQPAPVAEDRDYYDALRDSVPDVPEYPDPRHDY